MPGTASKGPEALSPWLHRTIQELAGRQGGPLTFGDFEAADIKLRMMTTNLTRRKPMRMPWPEHEYFFHPDEFRALFPAEVVQWMIDPSRRCRIRTTASGHGGATCAAHKPRRYCLSHTPLTCPSSSPPG